MRLAAVLVSAACWSLSACVAQPDEPPDTPGDPPDDYPGCHWDCFGDHVCEDGAVTTYDRGAVPCSEWEGECPNEVRVMCERGCRPDFQWLDFFEDPALLCEENRPKAVGDPCDDDLHCRPFTIVTQPDGTVSPLHLACDVQQGACVETEPPVIDGYMASCEVTPSDVVGLPADSYQLLDDTSCVTGLCLVDTGVDQNCVRQGCTITCTDHADCPADTVCEVPIGSNDGITPRVCMPRSEQPPFVDLSCPGEAPQPNSPAFSPGFSSWLL